MKQTAVEWLEMEIVKLEKDFAIPHRIYELCEQAKKMEKEQRVYSEEDMKEMYNKSCGLVGLGLLDDQTENNNRFRELIEQFNKKES